MYVKEADKEIVAKVKALGRLVDSASLMHQYPFCWRSETPLIYRVHSILGSLMLADLWRYEQGPRLHCSRDAKTMLLALSLWSSPSCCRQICHRQGLIYSVLSAESGPQLFLPPSCDSTVIALHFANMEG